MDESRNVSSTPSAFMRKVRPDVYSDSSKNDAYIVEKDKLEYVLETLTSRNETHEFEIFCRKLCERTICPNLKPATGPEGGGDSKADTETYPISEEVADRFYIGDSVSASERWAFAFSAKKTWSSKVRADVEGIVGTGRGYKRIVCVTARFCRAKTRADLEDELSNRFNVRVTILDRTWITEQVLEHGCSDLAFHYLQVGIEDRSLKLGPLDYSRQQDLNRIETELATAVTDDTIWASRVNQALSAAKLSRNLERPRLETDGRFSRAVRLAKKHGTHRQILDVEFERLWTAFWWFDDVELVNDDYDAFASLVAEDPHGKNLQLLGSITQLLFNSAIQQYRTVEQLKLRIRVASLNQQLRRVASDTQSPNSAAEAKLVLLTVEANLAILDGDKGALPIVWSKLAELVDAVGGLGEFDVDNLVRLADVMGGVAGNDPSYAALVDKVAAFVEDRTGEIAGAMILLRRARQINFTDLMEMIRLLGKAAVKLAKREHNDSLIEATQLLAVAYKGVGLNWAARAACIFSCAAVFVDVETEHEVPPSLVPTLVMLTWTCVELKHVPDVILTGRLLNYVLAQVPLSDAAVASLSDVVQQIDLAFAGTILKMQRSEFESMTCLPITLAELGLTWSRMSLMYMLGYEDDLRREGSIPEEQSSEDVLELFENIAGTVPAEYGRLATLSKPGESEIFSVILGLSIRVCYPRSPACIPVAETVIAILESAFATLSVKEFIPHMEELRIVVMETSQLTAPELSMDEVSGAIQLAWPTELDIGSFSAKSVVRPVLSEVVGMTLAMAFYVKDPRGAPEAIFMREGGLDRMSLVWSSLNSRLRIFGAAFASLDTVAEVQSEYPIRPVVPKISPRIANKPTGDHSQEIDESSSSDDHRRMRVFSVIDAHLWGRADWAGAAYLEVEHGPPALVLVFKEREAARRIFERWRDRFGMDDRGNKIRLAVITDIDPEHVAHYSLLITSNLDGENGFGDAGVGTTVSRTKTMTPSSREKLDVFLRAYEADSRYILVPGYLDGSELEFMFDLAIGKGGLVIRSVGEIARDDIESIALGEELFQRLFGSREGVSD